MKKIAVLIILSIFFLNLHAQDFRGRTFRKGIRVGKNGSAIDTIISQGDTIIKVFIHDGSVIYLGGSGGSCDLFLSDSTFRFITPTQLVDSLSGYLMVKDSIILYVTPSQLSDSLSHSTGIYENGLTKVADTIKLGGDITEDTEITVPGSSHHLYLQSTNGINKSSRILIDSNGVMILAFPTPDYSLSSGYSYFSSSPDGISMTYSNGLLSFSIQSNSTANTIYDNLHFKGLEYSADYSSGFTDRSLVDKAYVDSHSGSTAGFEIDSIVTDNDSVNAYMFAGGDTLVPYTPIAQRQELSDITPLLQDSTKYGPNGYVTPKQLADTSALLRSEISTGGGGSSIDKMAFIVGKTTNAPSAGDSLLTHGDFFEKHIEAWRNGLKQFYDTLNGISHADSTITFHPPFVSGDTIIVEATATSSWSTIALRDTSTGAVAVSDNFDSYTDGDLNGQGNWVADIGTITVASGTVYPNSADSIMYYYNATVANDQYAQLDISGSSSRSIGVLLRYDESTHSGYAAEYGNGNIWVWRLDNGVRTTLGYHYTVSEPLTLRAEISGTTLRVYVDGTQDSTIGDITDSNYSSGHIGLWGVDDSSFRVGDNFQGGDL